ncbi:MAG: allophanate hydrolase subunit 1 [Campylobacterota bacterium]|nr:allophanate hydrolase subunit 1 [Campylobacterota bacterium]
MNIKIVSVDSVMLYFEQIISGDVLERVQDSYSTLKQLDGVIDMVPSYSSILIQYDLSLYNYRSIQEAIKKQLSTHQSTTTTKESRLIKIPTSYDDGLDLERVAESNQLTVEEVILLHTQTIYRVYAIGFMVGFAFLASVNEKIATPRLSTPRAKVPKGSVAIADSQTAIYPQDSAGGWNIIGQTEFDDFEHFSVGDTVEFVRI